MVQPIAPFSPSRRFLTFILGVGLAEVARTMTMVQVPIFLRELGADIRQIGLFFTLALIFPLLLRILGGWFSDRIGHTRAMLFGSVAGTLAYVPYALAPSWQFALLGPALLAVATSLVAPAYRAYTAGVTEEHALGRAFGLTETARNIAWVIGPPLGGLIAQSSGYRWLFSAAIVSYAAASLVFLLLFRSTPDAFDEVQPGAPLHSLASSLRELAALLVSGGLVTWLLITDGVYDIASKLSFDLMPVYLSDIAQLSKQAIGFLDGMHGVAWVAAGYLGGWLADRTSERLGISLGLGVVIASRLIFALAGGYAGFALSWILLGLGGALIQPGLNALVAKGVPRRLLGLTFALLSTSLGLISLPFPWIGSQMWELLGPKTPFLLSVGIGLISVPLAWSKLRIPQEPEQSPGLAGPPTNTS